VSMSTYFVTSETTDDPLIVGISNGSEYAAAFFAALAHKPVRVEQVSHTECVSDPSRLASLLQQAYKIAWVTDVSDKLLDPETFSAVTEALAPHQDKTTVVFNLTSPFTEQVPGDIPSAAALFTAQEACVLHINAYLPSSRLLCGADVFDIRLPAGMGWLLCQDIQKGVVYAPQATIFPQTLSAFYAKAAAFFLQPQKTSVLIKGAPALADACSRQLGSLYQSYHFTQPTQQMVVVQAASPLPFATAEHVGKDAAASVLAPFSQSLPSPASKPFRSPLQDFFDEGALQQPESLSREVPVEPEVWDEPAPELPSQALVDSTPKHEADPSTPPQPLKSAPSRIQPAAPPQPKPAVLSDQAQDAPPRTEPPSRPAPFDLSREVQSIFTDTHSTSVLKHKKKIASVKKKTARKTAKRTALFYGGLAFTGVGLGIVCLALFFMVSLSLLKSSVVSALGTVFAPASEAAADADSQIQSLRRLQSVVRVQAETYSWAVSLPAIDEANQLVSIAQRLQDSRALSEDVSSLTARLYSQVVGTDTGDAVETAQNLASQSLQRYQNQAELHAELSAIAPLLAPPDAEGTQAALSSGLQDSQKSLQALQQFSPLLADILGTQEKRVYALLLQNNQELRPTGGFIESVALLSFQDGVLINLRVLNGMEIDGMLDGKVAAPPEIEKMLEKTWNFVDSNWDPHFPKAAEDISWFIEKSTGVAVDGVATIDFGGLATVLEAVGPLDLPEYNEVMTHKNLPELMEFHSEVALTDFAKDYRTEVFDRFMKKITTLPPENAGGLFGALAHNFSANSMQMAFKKPTEQQVLKNIGWSGALLKPNCPAQLEAKECIVDSVAQVEANIGANKANYYLARQIDHKVAITSTQAAHTRTVTFANKAVNESWPRGTYRAYVRFYLPSSTRLKRVRVGDAALVGDAVSLTQNGDHKVVGVQIEVPVASSQELLLEYTVDLTHSGSDFTYGFFEQQQSGSGDTPLSLEITLADELRPEVVAPQASVAGNAIRFSQAERGHKFFGVTFSAVK
jgi:hypothetical protein